MNYQPIIEAIMAQACVLTNTKQDRLFRTGTEACLETRQVKTLMYMALWRVIPCCLTDLVKYLDLHYPIEKAVHLHHGFLDMELVYRTWFDELETFAVVLKRSYTLQQKQEKTYLAANGGNLPRRGTSAGSESGPAGAYCRESRFVGFPERRRA